MRKKPVSYTLLIIVVGTAFWFYFQLTTYPYKVARWVYPLESKIIRSNVAHCNPGSDWLGVFTSHAFTYQGAYSIQVAYLNPRGALSSCEAGYKKEFFSDPVNADSRYRYASTSKLVTDFAISNLVQQGKIHLNDKFVDFFPELKRFEDDRVRQITISNLLDHRAGFNRLTLNGDPMFLRRNKPWCPHNLKQLESIRLSFNPGDQQIYSNLGYCLLGAVISRVTGEGFREYIRREFSLDHRNIKFINDYFYDDEVKYDYRYEEWYNDSYLKLFDFDSISSAAGLSGSAVALAQLLWDVHHRMQLPLFNLGYKTDCDLRDVRGCLKLGVFRYQPEENGIALHYHNGYLPGSASIAVIDSFGGVTVLVKSGANRWQLNPKNEWVVWIYDRLTLYYTLQGKLPVLEKLTRDTEK